MAIVLVLHAQVTLDIGNNVQYITRHNRIDACVGSSIAIPVISQGRELLLCLRYSGYPCSGNVHSSDRNSNRRSVGSSLKSIVVSFSMCIGMHVAGHQHISVKATLQDSNTNASTPITPTNSTSSSSHHSHPAPPKPKSHRRSCSHQPRACSSGAPS